MNESVWSPGTPRGLPGAVWDPRGAQKGVFGILGVGGGGDPPSWASLLPYVGSSLICPLRAAYGIMHDYFTRLVLCTTILLD